MWIRGDPILTNGPKCRQNWETRPLFGHYLKKKLWFFPLFAIISQLIFYSAHSFFLLFDFIFTLWVSVFFHLSFIFSYFIIYLFVYLFIYLFHSWSQLLRLLVSIRKIWCVLHVCVCVMCVCGMCAYVRVRERVCGFRIYKACLCVCILGVRTCDVRNYVVSVLVFVRACVRACPSSQ